MRLYPALTLTWTGPDVGERLELLLADLDGTDVLAVEETAGGARLYFAADSGRTRARAVLHARTDVAVRTDDVPDDGWARRSQADLRAVTAGGLTIAPPWAVTDELKQAGHRLIVIEPSMGFGTGHHATTRLCLRALQAAPLAGAVVLDVGTGSGVLAIAAARLGAARVAGIDVDPDALASARGNVELNGVADRVELRELDLRQAASNLLLPFDIVVANLTGGVLTREAAAFAILAAAECRLIASGFQPAERAAVLRAFNDAGWRPVDEDEEADWSCAVLARNSPSRLPAPPGP